MRKPDVGFGSPEFKELTNYKLFSQHVRPLIQRENPRVAQAKVVQLMGAMWREYLATNPVRESAAPTRRVREGALLESFITSILFRLLALEIQ